MAKDDQRDTMHNTSSYTITNVRQFTGNDFNYTHATTGDVVLAAVG